MDMYDYDYDNDYGYDFDYDKYSKYCINRVSNY